MGQYWGFHNIDKRETLSLSGSKLGEFFFNECTIMNATVLERGSQSWAGDRIICLGDYAQVRDLPKGRFALKELKRLGFREKDLGPLPFSNEEHLQEIDRTQNEQNDSDSDYECLAIDDALSRMCEEKTALRYYNDYSKYVLRNLSKKEYIRGESLRRLDNGLPSIGQALFSRICWSSDNSVSMCVPKVIPDISRGVWASDRLDLALLENVEEILEAEEWKDVSEETRVMVERTLDANDK